MTGAELTTPTSTPPERRSLGGLIVPLLLIALGAAFLAANLGYLPPISFRRVMSLWPIVLILVGFEVLLGRRQPLVALTLQLATIALGVALLAASPAGLFASATAPVSSATVPREGATALVLRLSGGAGDFTVTGGASALVEARSSSEGMEVETDREGGRAEVSIGGADGLFRFPGAGEGHHVAVAVASDIPAEIRVEAGAGDLRVDLSEVKTTSARIDAGAGDIVVVLPEPEGDVRIEIGSGAAEVVIEVPAGVEARVTVSGGAVSLDSTNSRLAARDGSAETPGYANASSRVTVSIDAGAASVHIR